MERVPHQTLDDYLCSDCQTSSPLQEVLSLCDNRMVLFDNKTTDEFTRVEQVNQLMKLVNRVVEQNGGKPYTNDIFEMLQKQAAILRDKQQFEADSLNSKAAAELISLKEEMNRSYEEQFQRLNEMISRKLRETTEKMEEKLRAEQSARLEAEKAAEEPRKLIEKLEKADMETKKVAEEARLRADEESHQLREQLKKAKIEARKLQKEAKEQCKELQKLQKVHDREAEELRRLQAEKNSCSIL